MVYSEKFYIGFSDVGADLGVLNSSILRIFEDVCCLQGEAVGDGFRDTTGRWFVTAYYVKVLKRPQYGEWVTARTWSREMKGVSASREFELLSADGEPMVIALSNWARFNSAVGKLERMSDEAFAKYESEPERHNFDDPWIKKLHTAEIERAARLRCEPEFSREYFVDRNLIDPNRHMNNVRYLDIASLVLPEEVYQLGEANEFEITYRKAIAYGETVACQYSEDDTARYISMSVGDPKDVRAIIKMHK